MKNQVIIVNKKKYAVGLFWQPIALGKSPRVFAVTTARGVSKNLNLYTEYRSMVGLGSTKFGHKSGMPIAVAGVMNALSEYSSFLAVFELGVMYYMVAVRNGIVLKDELFSSENIARQEYVKLFDIPDWNVLIAPSSWAMPRAIERKLPDIMSGSVRVVLHQIARVRSMVVSGVLLGVFFAVLFAIFKKPVSEMLAPRPNTVQINPELAAEYKRQIEEKNKQLDEQFQVKDFEKPKPEPIVLPYDNLPNVKQRAEICFQAMGFLMQPIPGWNQVSVECGEDSASVQIKRDFGTLGDFYTIATDLMPNSFVEEKNEDVVIVRAVLPDVKSGPSQDFRDADGVVRDITTRFQGINTDVDTNIVVDTLTNGVDTVNVNVVEVFASSKMVPVQFMEIFNDFGGVYMTRCEWNTARRVWNYEVIIYAK